LVKSGGVGRTFKTAAVEVEKGEKEPRCEKSRGWRWGREREGFRDGQEKVSKRRREERKIKTHLLSSQRLY
jgi:hypothetical protein